MIYLAAFLVFLALFFFLYAASLGGAPIIEKKVESQSPNVPRKVKIPVTTKAVNSQSPTFQPVLKDKLFNIKYPTHRNSSEEDLKIRKERSLKTENYHKYSQEHSDKLTPLEENIPFAELVSEDEIDFQPTPKVEEKPKPAKNFEEVHLASTSELEELVETPKKEVMPKIREIPRSKPDVLQIAGVLFLDYSRKIPFDYRKFRDIDWQENSFVHFKRIGSIKMLEYNGIVQFHAPNLNHELSLETIDQIVFYDNAFSLIPINPTLPASLVFSMETGKFKALMSEKLK
jgi:hypothetical protein